MTPKRRKTDPDKKTGKAATPLDDRQRILAEEEAKLRQKMEQYQKLIEDAPKIAKERARQRRDELITRASRTDARPGSRAALIDRRYYEVNVAAQPVRQRSLRSERHQGRMLFFLLLIVFSAVICWLYYTVTHT